jgi:hypothetical protein
VNSEPAASAASIAEPVFAELEDAVDAGLASKILDDPLRALSAAARLERLARTLAEHAAAAAIDAGMSWRDIGAAYGISKQAAHQRFARHVRRLSRAAAVSAERGSR